jgi:anti-sigma factor RsiW
MSDHPGDLLHAYLDNELEAPRALDIHAHLAGCAACTAELATAQAVRRAVKGAGRDEPSAALLRRLRPRRSRAPLFVGAAALAALALIVAFAPRPGARRFSNELALAHANALMANHLVDVASSDRHTVKPWFQGKVPYSLPVVDYAAQGFTLEGGRLQGVGNQTVAVLVYRYQAHLIDAFAWPAEPADLVTDPQQGYHLVATQAQGTHFVLVSDASTEVLQRLAALISAPN